LTTIQGIIPILSMPFHHDDSIDSESLVRQAEFLIGTGVDGIGFGFGSEIYRLTDAERDDALATVAGAVGGRVPIVAATGTNSTRSAVLRGQAAKAAGADVLMITPPAMASAGPAEVYAHYSTIAGEVGLPIIVQDAPTMTGVVLADTLLARLAGEIDLVAAVKVESMPPAPKVGTVAELVGDRAAVLGGAGGIDFVHELQRGGKGTIPGAALSELFVYVWSRFQAGDVVAARRCFNRFLPLLNLTTRSIDQFLFTQKEILYRRGVLLSSRLRTPSEHIDPVFVSELDQMLADLKINALGMHWDVEASLGAIA
jgi:dihydrodipicolinate synthase/N-acetylneuraminate lyase